MHSLLLPQPPASNTARVIPNMEVLLCSMISQRIYHIFVVCGAAELKEEGNLPPLVRLYHGAMILCGATAASQGERA